MLYVPRSAMIDLEREQHVNAQVGRAVALDAQVKEIDERLSIVWGEDRSDHPDIRPGRWHVKFTNATGPDMYRALTTEDGGYLEPHSGVLDWLRAQDLQNPTVWDDMMARRKRLQAERDAKDSEARQANKEEFKDRIKAYGNPGVSFGDESWANRHKDRKKR